MQHLEIIDYFGALAVWCSFFSIIFIISNTCIRICCIHKEDELTSFSLEELRPKYTLRGLIAAIEILRIASQQNF
ncbi:hypothetical protein GCK32_001052 [Trichostrongylus colubriformis]|uniref:Uncharacterized protein n=1 Tax=Trichostrongylus colubriformis TaxID=6319 RepID=A0AAN8IMZ3_TRICO